jgi:hypothetical protein
VRRPPKPAKLLDVSAAVGGASLRYLLEFFHLVPGISALHQAVAAGDPEGIRTVWDRLEAAKRERHLMRLALTAVDYHHVEVARWLWWTCRRRCWVWCVTSRGSIGCSTRFFAFRTQQRHCRL